ncbi:BgTH12-06028 [Blumeria graminis f. sp. triticale]|uniref:BgTH12-06028 n=1 Tax=Blumeria graminis f. sp. triticale TaxID=1689686 RepID=A0A9W4DQ41_BLUGR|nr:BgTH12-06028 [Blumeria graminis f. sp. triticale]
MASSACSALRSMSQTPTPWSLRYLCACKEATSIKQTPTEGKVRYIDGLNNLRDRTISRLICEVTLEYH